MGLQSEQILGIASRFQVCGARDQLEMLRNDLAKHEPWIARGTTAKGNVDCFPNQVSACIAQHEIQLHFWVRGQELHDPFDTEKVQKIRRRGHPHRAARGLSAARNGLSRVQHVIDRRRTAFIKGDPGAGQGQLAG